MSLYGRVDSTANQTAVGRTIGNSGGSVTKTIVFVDETEAGLAANKERGITAPGWWAYHTYTDSSGATRHRSEHLMFLTNPEANADETLTMTQSQQMQRTPSRSAPTTLTRPLLVVQQPSSLQRLLPTLVQQPSNGRRDLPLLVDSLTCLVQPAHLWHSQVRLQQRTATSIVLKSTPTTVLLKLSPT